MAPWITILSWLTLITIQDDLHIYFGMLLGYETLCTGLHHFLRTYTLCPFSGYGPLRWQQSLLDFTGRCWLWWLWSCTTFVASSLGLSVNLGWGNIGFYKLLQSNSSPEEVWNLGGYIETHMKITESICWVLLDPGGGKTVKWSTWGYVDRSNSCWPYDLKCRQNPCASYTIPRCEASWGGCCHHKNFLLLVVGSMLVSM